jgi:hypothetical protein
VPIALVMAWTFLNPRLFPPPLSTDNWASQVVLGERIFLARKTKPIPAHHQRWATFLTAVSIVGAAILIYGLWVLDVWAVLCGLVTSMGGKSWFGDRMVWLYHDTNAASA